MAARKSRRERLMDALRRLTGGGGGGTPADGAERSHGPEATGAPSFRVDPLEPRILLSATWTDADTGDPEAGATAGNDAFAGTDADEVADGLAGNDELDGAGGADLLIGGEGDDVLDGGAGDDVLVGGADDDVLRGGAGTDTADYSNASSGVTVDLSAGTATGGDGTDTLDSIERVTGSSHDDVFAFSSPADGDAYFVDGGGGDDVIDLSAYASSSVTFGDHALEIDLGGGQSFSVEYADVETVSFSDADFTVLDGDVALTNLKNTHHFIDGASAFSLDASFNLDLSHDGTTGALVLDGVKGDVTVVDLAGNGVTIESFTLNTSGGTIDLEADVSGAVTIGNALTGSLSVSGDVGSLDVGQDLDGPVSIGGDLGDLTIGRDVNAGIVVDGDFAGAVAVSGDLAGLLDVGGDVGGTITVSGSAASISAGGDFTATTNVGGALAGLTIDGSIDAAVTVGGDVTGAIDAGGRLAGSITAGGDVGTLRAGLDLDASATVAGNLGTLDAGGALGGTVTVAGDFREATIGGAVTGSVVADAVVGTFDAAVGGESFSNLFLLATEITIDGAGVSGGLFGGNDAPVVDAAVADQGATAATPFSFEVPAGTFSDPDGDPLVWDATQADGSALPAWLSFDPASRTFSGTPDPSDAGSVEIAVAVHDGNGGTAEATFTLVVGANSAPVVDAGVADQVATEDAPFSYQVPADAFADAEGDAMTYAAQLAGGGALPAWLSFDAGTRTFSGTPANGDVGAIDVEVTADDGNGGTGSDTFTITVADVNDAPTVDQGLADQAASEDAPFSYQFGADAFADVDAGDTVAYSARLAGGGALPSWLSFDAATRTFSGTPANGDVGAIDVEVTADDGNGGTVADAFTITVADVNDAPTVDQGLADQVATEDAAFSFTVPADAFADVDAGDSVAYTAGLAGGGALPAWLSFDPATGTFSGTPAEGDVGAFDVEVTAEDGSGATASDTFTITVANVNDAPTVDQGLADQAATEDAAFSYQFDADAFADTDAGDVLTYSAQLAGGGALPAWLDFDPATRTFSGTPANGDVGAIDVEVTADDGNGGTVADAFTITVADVNDAPTVDQGLADQVATEDAAFSFQVPSDAFEDVDAGDVLTFSAELSGGGALPDWLSFDPATRTFSGTPAFADVGSFDVEVTVEDASGTTATDTFTITVPNVNDAPLVDAGLDDQAATEDAPFSYQFAADAFADEEGDALSYTATLADGSPLPAWLSFDAATRTLSGTPLNDDVGTITVRITADDGNGGTGADTFDVVVANTNDAPTVDQGLSDQVAPEDSAFSYPVPSEAFEDVDLGDAPTYSAELAGGGALPGWLSFDPASRTFSGTPLNADVGTFDVTVTIEDGAGETASATFEIEVLQVNDDPEAVQTLDNQYAAEDVPFTYQVDAGTFTDEEGATLTWSATKADGSPLPAWLSFDPATRTFSGTPDNADVGTIGIEVTVKDGAGGEQSEVFALIVSNSNDAPVVADGIPDQTGREDIVFNYKLPDGAFSDEDGDTLSFTAQGAGGGPLPSWLSFDPSSRTFTGTPTTTDIGTHTVEVVAGDDDGLSAVESFDIEIFPVGHEPVVAVEVPWVATGAGEAFTYDVPGGTFYHPHGSDMDLTAELADGSPLPSWLDFDEATGRFSGTPGAGDVGVLEVRVHAEDLDGDATFDDFKLVVAQASVDPTPVVLTGDLDVAGFTGSTVYMHDDHAFTVTLEGAGTADVTYDRETETLAVTGVSGTDATTNLVIDDIGDTAIAVDTVAVTESVGRVEVPSGTGTVTVADGATVGEIAVGGTGVGAIEFLGGIPSDLTVTGGTATLAVAGNVDGNVVITGDVSGMIDVEGSWTGTLNANSSVATMTVGGTLSGDLFIAGDLDELTAGSITSVVTAEQVLGDLVIDDEGVVSSNGFLFPTLIEYDGVTDTLTAKISGTNAADAIDGTEGVDEIDGSGGNDYIRGFGDDDVLMGGSGNDVIEGGDGNDTIEGKSGNDRLRGGAGDDVLDGGAGSDEADYSDTSGPVTVDLGAGTASGDGDDVLVDVEGVRGSTGDDDITGDAGNNYLYGGEGDDAIDGAAGDDWLAGDAGADTLTGGAGDDSLIGGAGDDVMDGGSGTDRVRYDWSTSGVTVDLDAGTAAGDGDDTLTDVEDVSGSRFDDVIAGDDEANDLDGNAGDDVIDGGIGDDRLSGDGGDDILIGGAGQDTADFASSSSGITADLDAGTATGQGSDSLIDIEHLAGSNADDVLKGDDGDNRIEGRGGDDRLEGGLGDDVLDGDGGTDTVDYTAASGSVTVDLGAGTATGAAGDDVVRDVENVDGTAYDDDLTGSEGANRIDGGAGDDTIDGGAGDDALLGGDGVDRVAAGTGDDLVLGGAGDDQLEGDAGDDRLRGGTGDDVISGGDGIDVVDFQDAAAGVTVDLDAGTASGGGGAGESGTDTLSGIESVDGSAHDDVVDGDANANVLRGFAGDDQLAGRAGDDVLEGGGGADVLEGGDGDDVLRGESRTDVGDLGSAGAVAARDDATGTGFIMYSATEVQQRFGDAPPHESGASNLVVVVNDGGQWYYDDNDSLVPFEPEAGDVLLAEVDFDADTVTALEGEEGTVDGVARGYADGDLSFTADRWFGASNDGEFGVSGTWFSNHGGSMSGDDLLEGGAGADTLEGGVGDDTVRGGAGDDVIIGGPGADVISGDGGIDELTYEGRDEGAVVDLAAGTAGLVGDDVGTVSGVENVTGSSGDDTITGDAGVNELRGGAGADAIDGGAGDDVVEGGAGDDVLDGGTGADTVRGGTGDDVLSGGLGNDVLDGGAGTDTVDYSEAAGAVDVDLGAGIATGADGTDMLTSIEGVTGSDFDDAIEGGDTDDRLEGGAGADDLDGDAGDDVLDGGSGDDRLTGDAGDDEIVGGDGTDTAVFRGYWREYDITDNGDGTYTVADTVDFRDGTDTVSEVELFEFKDGTIPLSELLNRAPTDLALPGAEIPEDVAPGTVVGTVTWSDPNSLDRPRFALIDNAGGRFAIDLDTGEVTVADGATFDFESAEHHDITVRVTDDHGAEYDETLRIDVADVNETPVVDEGIDDQTTLEDEPFSFTVPADAFFDQDAGTDLDYDATMANGDPLPAWLSFDADTGTFTGTPTNDEVGTYDFEVTVTDGEFVVSDTFTLTVRNVNDAPTVDAGIDDQSTLEDAAFSFTPPADTFEDVDLGDTRTYAATLANGDPLPAWLSIDPATGELSGTPENDDVGVITVRLSVTDATGASAATDFDLEVVNTNDAPTVDAGIADRVTLEDQPFSFTVPADAFEDVDVGDTHVYAATLANGDPLPAWLSFDPATGTLSGTPVNDDVGAYDVSLTITDAAGESATETFTVTVVNVNDAPTVDAGIDDQSTLEDAAFSFTPPADAFEDVDLGDTRTYAATLANGDPLPAWLSIDPATGELSGTPENDDVGVVTVRLSVTDAAGASVATDFDLEVVNTNDAPTVDAGIPAMLTLEDEPFAFSVPANAFEDVDLGDTHVYAATLANGDPLPAWLSFDPATGGLTGTPVNEDVGAYDVALTITDAEGTSATEIFRITVVNVNDAPTVDAGIGDLATLEDDSFSFTPPADAFEDVDLGDTHLYAATLADGDPLPAWLSIDPDTGTLSGTPRNDDVGTIDVRLSITDAAGETVATDFALEVINTNDVPTAAYDGILYGQVEPGESITVPLPAGAFEEVDAEDRLRYELRRTGGGSVPSWITIDAETGTITATPLEDTGSVTDLVVIARDLDGTMASIRAEMHVISEERIVVAQEKADGQAAAPRDPAPTDAMRFPELAGDADEVSLDEVALHAAESDAPDAPSIAPAAFAGGEGAAPPAGAAADALPGFVPVDASDEDDLEGGLRRLSIESDRGFDEVFSRIEDETVELAGELETDGPRAPETAPEQGGTGGPDTGGLTPLAALWAMVRGLGSRGSENDHGRR